MLGAFNTDYLEGVTQFFENEQDFGADVQATTIPELNRYRLLKNTLTN
jgi:hypothetical protein